MKSLLKPLSVLEIIIGILTVITAALILISGGYIDSVAQTSTEGSLSTLFTVYGAILIISALFNLACGFCGLKGAKGNQKKLNTAIKLGWIGFIMAIVSIAMTFIGNNNISVNNILSSIASAVVPLLFLLSAKSNKE